MLHAGVARARGDGAAAPGGEDGQHVAGDDAGNAVRRRQDPHADGAVSPGDGRRVHPRPAGGRRPAARRRADCRAVGARGRLRRQRLGSAAGARGAVGRRRASARRRPRRRAARRERGDDPAGHGGARPGVRGGRRTGAGAVRRGAELRQPLPRVGGPVPCVHPEPDRGDDGDHARGRRHQPAAQPGRDVGLRPGVAGQDHQGGSARRQGPARERRDGGERGRPAALVRPHRRRPVPEEGVQALRRLVLRATRAASAAVDARGQRRHRGEGARAPAGALRRLLPVPSGHAVGVSAEMERAAAVPADPRHAGHAGPVDLVGAPRRIHEGAHGAADHPRLGPPRRGRLRRRRARPAGRSAPVDGHRRRHRRGAGACQGSGRRQQGRAPRHPSPRGNDDAVRVVGRAGRPGGPSARAALRPRRAVHRDHLGRQRRDGPGGTLLLPPPRRHRRLPDQLSAHDQEGRQRPPCVAGRGRRDPARHPQPGQGGLRPGRDDSPRLLPGRRRCDLRHPEADARGDGPRSRVDRCGRRRAETHPEVDSRPRRVSPALPRCARLGRQEARPRAAGQSGAVARLEACRQRGGGWHLGDRARPRGARRHQDEGARGGRRGPRGGLGRLSLDGDCRRLGERRAEGHRPRRRSFQ